MSSKSFLLMLVGTVYAIGTLQAQAIETLLKEYDIKIPQEKIYIHFDNSLYTPGQTIWYKAYVLKGNEPSDLSKNLYIDWFDEKGKFVDRLVAPIVGSTASGSFSIPAKYSGTQLQVLAYTRWMLNLDSAFLFHKNIPVAQTPVIGNTGMVTSATTLRFFPEGGDLVENISSTIAFKAQKQGGMPCDISGIILDKNGKRVTSFASVHNGMGKLVFTPLSGEVYTAEWTDVGGNKHLTILPSAKTEGIQLSINAKSPDPEFFIERQANTGLRFIKGSIVAQMNRRVVFRAGFDLSIKTKLNSSIPINNLPSGILQVTVFDSMHVPLAERIVYVNNDNYLLPVNLHTDTVNLSKRGKNVYEIDVPDSVTASLSLAVTDGETKADSSTNIVSQFLLSGEIKGYVHEPAFYFSSPTGSSREGLDLVMLTNGWRRFNWTDVWNAKTPELAYTPDSNYLSINGTVEGLNEKQIQKAGTLNMILVTKQQGKHFLFTPLKKEGAFAEKDLFLYGTTQIFYKINNTMLTGNKHVTIRNSFLPFDNARRIEMFQPVIPNVEALARIKMIDQQQNSQDSIKSKTTLQDVTVTTKFRTRLEQLDEKYATGPYSGHSSAIYEFNLIDDSTGNTRTSLMTYLENKMRAFQSQPPRLAGKFIVFLLNEETVSSSEVSRISVAEVAYVKAFPSFRTPTLSVPTPGVIVIYTKKGKELGMNSAGIGEMNSVFIEGYSPVKEFYLPENGELPMNGMIPDLRRTLYWKPNILVNSTDRKIRIAFTNNDISSSLRIVLEGFAADGRLIHINKLLQ
jgi:hypothetical protein